ncbi:MAG TPA: glucan 1,4-alpha-glucosidase [Gemmatimonadaceae bacterium]|jgi:glucoamylase|nr:glucan 1,4-alpha-glucosidase [Gemmatimonadaceae bacterium]
MMAALGVAPGGPGIAPRWTSSAKSGVGTAMSARSMVWFTISHGIVNEVYYPRVDQANVRDMGLIVTAPAFFAEEKRHTDTAIRVIEAGVPGFSLTNTCREGRFRIEKTILTDPDRDVLLQATQFVPLKGRLSDYRMFVLLAPHLANQGEDNTAWVGDYKGVPMLFAQRANTTVALSCSAGFGAMGCGFVGVNDGWQQIVHHGRLTECYARAEHGNVALTGEIDLRRQPDGFALALAFGHSVDEAAHAARASLLTSFKGICGRYIGGWKQFHARSRRLGTDDESQAESRLSVAVLQTHEDKVRQGAFIASLSIPWGNDRGDHDLGGYHVVWPRDLVEIAGALLASGHLEAARNALHYLMTTQDADGHWPQNMWLDGRAYWPGNQLDETAFPVLLADQLRRKRALSDLDVWPMVRRAASYLLRTGPVTPEDRWEEDGGYSTFTIAAEISALLAAADFADAARDRSAAACMRETADIWYDALDRWTYVTDTELSRLVGVAGYYVRIAPPNESAGQRLIPVRNQAAGDVQMAYDDMVSPDALALVRFGLRDAHDQRILDTVRVVDRVLCTATRNGPAWHRYNDDGYGEHADGSPFDGSGIGRGWPLLAGERGHYEVAAGRLDQAAQLLDVMRRQAGFGGLIPEQVWDAADIPDRGLFHGCPSGSAMPLAWAHAEYVKLARSLRDKRVFDMPPQTTKRYGKAKRGPRTAMWRFNNRIRWMDAGLALRIDLLAPAVVHWTPDEWRTVHDVSARDTTMGVFTVALPTESLPVGRTVRFTFYWSEATRWEGEDFAVVTRPAE